MRNHESSYKVRTAATATLAALGVITAGCSAGAISNEHTPKPSHSTSTTHTGKKSSAAKTTHPTSPTTYSNHPESSASATTPNKKLTITDISLINLCTNEAIGKAVQQLEGNGLICYDGTIKETQEDAKQIPGNNIEWVAKGLTPSNDPPNYVAEIIVDNAIPGGFSDYAPDYIGVIDGETSGWDPNALAVGASGKALISELKDSTGVPVASVGVTVLSRGAIAPFEANEQLMDAVLKAIGAQGDIGLSGKNVAPACLQQKSC